MAPRVLYQASAAHNPVWLISLFFLIAIPAYTIREWKRVRTSENVDDRLGLAIGLTGTILMLFVAIVIVPYYYKMYSGTVAAYQKGEYAIVEGYVEDFHPMPYSGHDKESFTINGVRFAYTDYSNQYGYHTTSSHGGVIRGNGQHLRIGYTCYGLLENVIVYIEELP